MKNFFLLVLSLYSFFSLAQDNIGVGTTTPDASALLELNAADKGLLIPRLNLQSASFPAPGPANQLLVFNTNPAFSFGAGLYFNAGTPALPDWLKVVTEPLPNTTLQVLSEGAGINPFTYDGSLAATVSVAVNGITSAMILDGAVTGIDIADATIQSVDIEDGGIQTVDIADDAIDGNKLGIGTAQGDILYYTGTQWTVLPIGVNNSVLVSTGSAPSWVTVPGATYTAGNDLDLVGNAFEIESQLDFVHTIIAPAANNLGLSAQGANNIIFSTGGNEQARLTSTGNLGLGTTNPTEKLQVEGNLALNGALKGSVRVYNNDPGVDIPFGNQNSWATQSPVVLTEGTWFITAGGRMSDRGTPDRIQWGIRNVTDNNMIIEGTTFTDDEYDLFAVTAVYTVPAGQTKTVAIAAYRSLSNNGVYMGPTSVLALRVD